MLDKFPTDIPSQQPERPNVPPEFARLMLPKFQEHLNKIKIIQDPADLETMVRRYQELNKSCDAILEIMSTESSELSREILQKIKELYQVTREQTNELNTKIDSHNIALATFSEKDYQEHDTTVAKVQQIIDHLQKVITQEDL